MQADDSVWVHNDERFGPAGPELSQQDPNNRSDAPKRGRDRFRLSTPSCWRRASTSRAVSVRLRMNTRTTIRKARRNESTDQPL
jgi:hypothetical protein